MQINETIEYSNFRCWDCGTFWAVETSLNRTKMAECPHCAHEKIKKAQNDAKKSERAMRGLRGVMKRLKKSQ